MDTITHSMETWFLVMSLFLPRLTLLIAWLSGTMPYNNIPFWGDAVMAVFIPRVLILIYIYGCLGVGGWFWVHMIFAILSVLTFKARVSSKND